MTFPTIDRGQSKKQLELLGYKSGDNIYLRFFYPSDDPRKGSDGGRKLDKLVFKNAEKLQAEGRGCYFVVNGGGHNDDAVSHGRAIFFEHDDRPKEQSAQMWAELGLPEPTFQVDTGGKSIHSYWVFDQPIAIEDWRSLQADLLEFADADRQLKNPSRVMRLAGAWHVSPRGNFPSYICACSEKKYSFQEMRDRIPEQKNTTVTGDSHRSGDTRNGYAATITTTVTTVTPSLEIFLSRDDRNLIASGAASGSRNGNGAKLARNLIGTAERLHHLGIRFDGEPYQIFLDYCQKCQQSRDWNQREWDLIWKSAKADSPTPTLTDDALQTCHRAWEWKQKKQHQSNGNGHQNGKNTTVTGDSHHLGDSCIADRLSASATVTTVTQILEKSLKDWEEQAELDKLASQSELSKDSFWRLVATVRSHLDDVLDQDKAHLNKLIEWGNADLDFSKALPSMAVDILHDAKVLNVDPISLWQYLLPVTLSLVGKKANLDIGSHEIPAIAWTALIGESGTGKTRAEKVILAPLKKWQAEESERFKKEQETYKDELTAWNKSGGDSSDKPEPPTPERKFWFEIGTIQAAMRRLSEQGENGTIWARDELAGLFKSLDQFSGSGESEALECLLKLWDGDPAQVERVRHEDSYFVPSTRLSLAGGLQPLIFRRIFKDADDPQGMQARFLFALNKPQKPKRTKGSLYLSSKLPLLYRWLDGLPQINLKLSPAADKHYDNLYEQIGEEAERGSNPAVRVWLRKLPTQVLRIAIALHFIECYHDQRKNWEEIQMDTLDRAMLFAVYYRSVFSFVQESATSSTSVSSILLKVWDLAATSPDGLLPRDAYRAIKAIGKRARELNRPVGAYTLDLFYQLSELGKGRVDRSGRHARFFVTAVGDKKISLETGDSGDSGCDPYGVSDTTVTQMVTVTGDSCASELSPHLVTLTYEDLTQKAQAGEIPAFDEQDVDYLVSEIAQARSAIDFQEWRLTALDQVQGEQLWAAVCDRLKVVDPEVYQKWFASPDSVTSSGDKVVNRGVDTAEKSAALSFYEPGDMIVFDGQQYPVVKSDLTHVWLDGHATHTRVAISEVRPASVEE